MFRDHRDRAEERSGLNRKCFGGFRSGDAERFEPGHFRFGRLKEGAWSLQRTRHQWVLNRL
jgi:hypothetical protein